MSRIPVRTPSRAEDRNGSRGQDASRRPASPMFQPMKQANVSTSASVSRPRSIRNRPDDFKTPSRPVGDTSSTFARTLPRRGQVEQSGRSDGDVSNTSTTVSRARSGISTLSTQESTSTGTGLRKAKSSAALREHIAKARAELQKSTRRPTKAYEIHATSAQKGVDSQHNQSGVDDPFSYIDDPFNQEQHKPKPNPALDHAIQTARATGSLNISNLQLYRISDAVYNMYKPDPSHVIDFSMDSGSAWYDYSDLTHLNAADNEIAAIEDSLANVFGGVESIDLHNNVLTALPQSLLQLSQMTTLNLAGNKLCNDALDLICQMEGLMELNMSRNTLKGTLTAKFANLQRLSTLDLRNNQIAAIDWSLIRCVNLQRLNLSSNQLCMFSVSQIANLTSLIELDISHNKIASSICNLTTKFPRLESLNLSHNVIPELTIGNNNLELPSLVTLLLLQNRLKTLDGLVAPKLINLNIEGNQFTTLPESVFSFLELRHLDISDNRLTELSYRLGFMHLSQFRWQGNPVQMRGVYGMSTEKMLNHLRKYAPKQ